MNARNGQVGELGQGVEVKLPSERTLKLIALEASAKRVREDGQRLLAAFLETMFPRLRSPRSFG